MHSLQIFSALSMTTVLLGSRAFFFNGVGKASADYHRAIVQFQVRERGRRIIRRI